MLRKETVIKLIDDWINNLSDRAEEIEVVLLMVKNKILNLPDEMEDDMR